MARLRVFPLVALMEKEAIKPQRGLESIYNTGDYGSAPELIGERRGDTMGNTPTFQEVNTEITERYQAGDYDKALALASRHLDDFPDRRVEMIYWRLCMSARVEEPEMAMRVLEQALDEGYWFSEAVLRESPSLVPLVGMPTYEELIARSAAMAASDMEEIPRSVVIPPEGRTGPLPMLLGLHENVGTALSAQTTWGGLGEEGYLLAFPSSSQQGFWKGGFIWDDRDAAVRDVSAHFAAVCEEHQVDADSVIITGHSMGGQLAIWLALSGTIKARGFITVGPYLPDEEIDTWGEMVESAKGSGMRGVIFLGEKDGDIPHEGVYALSERLNAAGIDCKVEFVPGEGHAITPEYQRRFPKALRFVAGK
jgi:predicted esterase